MQTTEFLLAMGMRERKVSLFVPTIPTNAAPPPPGTIAEANRLPYSRHSYEK